MIVTSHAESSKSEANSRSNLSSNVGEVTRFVFFRFFFARFGKTNSSIVGGRYKSWRYHTTSYSSLIITLTLPLHLLGNLLLRCFVPLKLWRHFADRTFLDLCQSVRKVAIEGERYEPCLRSYITSSSSFVRKVMDTPVLPARPVRPMPSQRGLQWKECDEPMRWTYASIVFAIWKLMTSETFGTSIPRPARSVATRTSTSPLRNC